MKDLDRLHSVHLEIADELHRICMKHNIDYFMSAGTMLGAIRHQGFIPWDDDFDTGMTRKNYDYLLQVIDKEISEDFYYISLENNPKYSLRYIKVMKKGTELKEAASAEDIENYGIFIDVFVFDNVPESKLSQFRHNVSVEIFQKLLYAKSKNKLDLQQSSIKSMIYKTLKVLVKPISREWLIKSLMSNMTRYNDQESEYITNVGEFFANYKKEMIQLPITKNLKLYKFEDREYYGFVEYDEYLTNKYGNWRKLPPKEERRPHHDYLYVKFDSQKQ